jgi:hypothetical protein
MSTPDWPDRTREQDGFKFTTGEFLRELERRYRILHEALEAIDVPWSSAQHKDLIARGALAQCPPLPEDKE